MSAKVPRSAARAARKGEKSAGHRAATANRREFMEQVHGAGAGNVVTVLILCIALSSLFAVVLGYSRVPYAAARDGNFFRAFAKLHPTKNFPYISLTLLCAVGLLFSLLFRLGDVIKAILAMRILVQFIGQAVGVVLLRKHFGSKDLPFRMWLFPLPVILSVAVWIFLLQATGWFALWGSLIAAAGVVVFCIKEKRINITPETFLIEEE
jgi:amino acid transporter